MKRFFYSITVLLLLLPSLWLWAGGNQTFYVSLRGSGDGTSWQEAQGDLAAVLSLAQPGDQVWVAAGTYTPTRTGDRQASFVISEGVALYGGFAGFETALSQRRWEDHPTILSGDIGEAENVLDNSYTVVYLAAVSEATILDGFYITGARADGDRDGVHPFICGGGILVDSEGRSSAPLIRNCVIYENYALYGAGLYVHANGGDAAPKLINCVLKKNHAELYGGGIRNDGRQGSCRTTLIACSFIGNYSLYGAGIANHSESGDCIISLDDCHFKRNFAEFRGGAILSKNKGEGEGKVFFTACSFDGNTSTVGRESDEADFKAGSGAVTF